VDEIVGSVNTRPRNPLNAVSPAPNPLSTKSPILSVSPHPVYCVGFVQCSSTIYALCFPVTGNTQFLVMSPMAKVFQSCSLNFNNFVRNIVFFI